MVFLRIFRHSPVRSFSCGRGYATNPPASIAKAISAEASKKPASPSSEPAQSIPSCCTPNTALTGLNYLKGQPPVLALSDEEYPLWLWSILRPKVYPNDGPGGKAEKVLRRAKNRQRIKDQNFMKTQ